MNKENYWSRFAKNFDDKQKYAAGKYLTDLLKEQLRVQKNLGRVLELGCGNGAYTQCIMAEAESITATDFSQEMVEETKKVFEHHNKIKVEQADCHKSPYPDESFETILMANLIHVIDDPVNVLKECHRLLKSNGILLITCFTTDKMSIFQKLSLLYRFKKTFGNLPKTRTPFGVKSLSHSVRNNNFDVEETALLGEKTKAIFLKAIKK